MGLEKNICNMKTITITITITINIITIVITLNIITVNLFNIIVVIVFLVWILAWWIDVLCMGRDGPYHHHHHYQEWCLSWFEVGLKKYSISFANPQLLRLCFQGKTNLEILCHKTGSQVMTPCLLLLIIIQEFRVVRRCVRYGVGQEHGQQIL